MRRLLFSAALTAALATPLAGCARPKETSVDHAWVRLPAVPHQPGAAYFDVHAGATDMTLIAVSSDVAIRSEMHETMRSGGMTSMKPLSSVSIPARGMAQFRPGGRHVMLFDINAGIRPGAAMTMTFSFSNGLRIQQDATAIGAGDPAPKGS